MWGAYVLMKPPGSKHGKFGYVAPMNHFHFDGLPFQVPFEGMNEQGFRVILRSDFLFGPKVGGRWYSQNCHVNSCGKWMIHYEIWGFPKPIFPICHSGLLVNPPWQTRLDQGLTVSAHYLAQAVYEAPTDQDEPLSALEVVPRLLANCSCVEDVIKLLESVKVVAPKLLVVGFDLYVFCFKLYNYIQCMYIYI
jgi:hypothetical protein